MKLFEQSLDLVLQTLVNNGDSICIYETENTQSLSESKLVSSPAYTNLFLELGLTKREQIEILDILREKDFVSYSIVSGVMGASIFVKIKSDNTVGNTPFDATLIGLAGRPNMIKITLKGKFFLLGGGYTGKQKKEAKAALLQNTALWIIAFGAGLGGIYVIAKAIMWIYCLFLCD